MEIKLPATWLVSKGIKISPDDDWYNGGYEKVSEEIANLLNSGSTISGFITSFADRENTGEQPVADWVPVNLGGSNEMLDRETRIASEFKWQRGVFPETETWKPDAKELMEMYTTEQNKIKEIESKLDFLGNTANVYGVEQPTMVSDAIKKETKNIMKAKTDLEWLALELNEWSYFGMVAHTVIGDEIHWHPSNMQGFTQEQWQDKRYELGLDKKETKLKLTKDDVGKEFLCNGHIAEVCNISDSAERFVLYTSTDGFIIVNKNGESCTSDTFQLEQYEPRYWLKDLPDADLFSKDVSSIHFEGDMNWYVTDVNGHDHWLPYGDLPKLDDNDRKLSKISIDDLREWKRVNESDQ